VATVTTGANDTAVLAADPQKRFIFLGGTKVGPASGTVTSLQLDGSGNVISVNAPVAFGTNITGVAIDPTGRFLYAADNSSGQIGIFSINSTTGVLTQLGQVSSGGTNLFELVMVRRAQ
jgi:6-phosphogluconolactonase